MHPLRIIVNTMLTAFRSWPLVSLHIILCLFITAVQRFLDYQRICRFSTPFDNWISSQLLGNFLIIKKPFGNQEIFWLLENFSIFRELSQYSNYSKHLRIYQLSAKLLTSGGWYLPLYAWEYGEVKVVGIQKRPPDRYPGQPNAPGSSNPPTKRRSFHERRIESSKQ